LSAKKSHQKLSSASWQFDEVIWQIIAHPLGNIIFIEERNQANKQVRFSAIDLQAENFLWRNITFEESWWISLTASGDDVLYFTVYTNPQNPENKSLMAYNFRDQRILWFRNNLSFLTLTANAVHGFDSRLSRKIQVKKTDGDSSDTLPVGESSIETQVMTPHRYTRGTSNFETVYSFLKVKFGFEPSDVIEYLEFKEYVIISYYLTGNSLANYLLVLDGEGDVCVEEILGERLEGIAVDSFFMLSGFLIFVKNKTVLVSCKLL